MTRHGGKILLDDKLILTLLGYPGGNIHFFGKSEDYLATVIVIEHPSMPEVTESAPVPIVHSSTVIWNFKEAFLLRFYPSMSIWKILSGIGYLIKGYFELVAMVRKDRKKLQV